MRVRTIGLLPALILVAAFAAPADAQTGRNELSVFGGVSLSDVRLESRGGVVTLLPAFPELIVRLPPRDGSVSVDGSAEFGVRYGRRVTNTVTVEADFSVAPSHQLNERIGFGCPPPLLCIAGAGIQLFAPDILRTTDLVAYHYGGSVRLDLTRGTVRPSVIGGLGGVTYDANNLRASNLAIRVGGAVTASMGSTTARIEVIDVIVADHFATGRAEHDPHVRVGLGVRW